MLNKVNKLINVRQLSHYCAKNGTSIRSNYIPDKYQRQVEELNELIEGWQLKYAEGGEVSKSRANKPISEVVIDIPKVDIVEAKTEVKKEPDAKLVSEAKDYKLVLPGIYTNGSDYRVRINHKGKDIDVPFESKRAAIFYRNALE